MPCLNLSVTQSLFIAQKIILSLEVSADLKHVTIISKRKYVQYVKKAKQLDLIATKAAKVDESNNILFKLKPR